MVNMTKKPGNAGYRTNRDANATQRAALAVKLRSQKMQYGDIAKQCGYASRGAAYVAVQRELERVVAANVDELRREEALSLDELEKVCWERLYNADYEKPLLFAVDRIIAIKERRAKLFGLDQPVLPANLNANVVIVREVPPGLLTPPDGGQP